MTDIYTVVCQAAAKLQAEGKTPSLALIRAQAGKGLDAAALFSAYQQWRSQPPAARQDFPQAAETKADRECTAAESLKDNEIILLREELAQLHRKVDQLILLVEALGSPQGSDHVRR